MSIIRRAFSKLIRLMLSPVSLRSYSQAGEDAVIRFLFSDKNITNISYLDIGTNIPDLTNNTYLFYLSGSSGVCVEADKSLIEQIRKTRPRDKVLNVGVAAYAESEAEFYIFNHGMNTFDKVEAKLRSKSGRFKILETVRVKLIDINTVISENFEERPDFLSLDIEGLDLSVLKALDFTRYPIPVICVETCMYSETNIRPKDLSIIEFMNTKGYEVYADTYINTIFVNRNWFYSL